VDTEQCHDLSVCIFMMPAITKIVWLCVRTWCLIRWPAIDHCCRDILLGPSLLHIDVKGIDVVRSSGRESLPRKNGRI
jgi:hypothetical protein